ncbi:hypothetical protein NLJ89_g10648 [Agrocybe chaxingu]|uniref:Uncharacterized protein n=1 Tax=Agrocybe chaxingu TaxID=84603 RepID=A0A9W8MQ33_9AGAR|nr:hypothetical protein NLJ89_g10648 [Agrocybe chaxingu]
MGCKHWTTDDQREWLTEFIPEFLACKKRRTEFFPTVLKSFNEKWPIEDTATANVEGAAGGSDDNADSIAKAREKRDDQVMTWFSNHTRPITSGSGNRGVLKMTSTRLMQSWQAYSHLMYEAKWKPIIEAVWKEKVAAWKEQHDTPIPDKYFNFMNNFLREKYEQETPEVLEQVEELHNEQLQNAIDKVPRTVQTIGTSLHTQTGWNVTIMLGGPSPKRGGQIVSYVMHFGKNQEGEDYQAYLGDDYEDAFLSSFDDFLNDVFPLDVCLSRSLGAVAKDGEATGGDHSEAPQKDPNEESTVPDKRSEGKGHKEGTTNAGGVTKSQEKIPELNMSDYEREKAANIERNKALFKMLFPTEESLKIGDKPTKPKSQQAPKTKRSEPTRTLARHKNSRSTSAPTVATSSRTPSNTSTGSSDLTKERNAADRANAGTGKEATSGKSTQALAPGQMGGTPTPEASKDAATVAAAEDSLGSTVGPKAISTEALNNLEGIAKRTTHLEDLVSRTSSESSHSTNKASAISTSINVGVHNTSESAGNPQRPQTEDGASSGGSVASNVGASGDGDADRAGEHMGEGVGTSGGGVFWCECGGDFAADG